MFKVDVKEGLRGFKKGLIVGLLIGLLMLLATPKVSRAENLKFEPIVNQIKTWDFSLGDYCYLLGAKTHNYAVGISKDIGESFMGKDWLDLDIGYIRSLENTNPEDREYGFFGPSLNVGRGITEGIEWIAQQFKEDIEFPEFLKKNILKVGFIGAVNLKEDFPKKWDYGPKVKIVEISIAEGVKVVLFYQK